MVRTRVQQIQDGGRPPFGEVDKSRYHRNGLTNLDEIWQDDADPIGRQNFEYAKNQDGKRPLPEVVYISITEDCFMQCARLIFTPHRNA